MWELIAADVAIAIVLVGLGVAAGGRRAERGERRRRAEVATGAALVGLAVLLSFLSLPGPTWLSVPIYVVAALAWSIWFSLPVKNTGLGLVSTAMFSLAVVFSYGSFVHDWSRTVEPSRVVETVPQRAHEVDGATLTFLQQTRCRPELSGTYGITRNFERIETTVAPLVHQSWGPGQPVHAWIILDQLPSHGMSVDDACAPEGGLGSIAALRVLRAGHNAGAVAKALKRHGLTEAEDAPVFRFAPTERWVARRLWGGRISAVFLLGCWAWVLLASLWKGRKTR